MSGVTRAWLERLYGQSPGHFAVVRMKDGIVKTTWYATGELDQAARHIKRYAKDHDLYTSVATFADPGPREADRAISLAGLWCDLDVGEAGHQPAELPNPATAEEALSILDDVPEPSAVIHSGGGLQAWHLFEEPWVFEPGDTRAADTAAAWQQRLIDAAAAKGWHIDPVADLARIMRVSGTVNHKLPDTPRPVRLEDDRAHRYPVEEFAALVSDASESSAGPGDQQGADDFPKSWAEILEPMGWTVYGEQRGGGTYWLRPGKDKSEGKSAVTDPLGAPVMVNFSGSAGLPVGKGQHLTKLRVYAALYHDDDEQAARKALGIDLPQPASIAERFASAKVDWSTLWTAEIPEPDWLCEPLIERGRGVAIFSEAKAGKSLLLFEICLALSGGRPVLGNPAREPITVLYIDLENTEDDLREHGMKMGFGGEDLPRLHYYSFPDLAWLDTEAGGKELLALARYHDADLVVIDTLSRVVEGDENSNDTFRHFYNHTGVRLKRDKRACVRLDHSGKDPSKGMRGGSAKSGDVDEVWWLKAKGDLLELERTHSRSKHGKSFLIVERRDDPLRHDVESWAVRQETQQQSIIDWLIEHDIDPLAGKKTAWAEAKEHQVPYSREAIWAAMDRHRKEQQDGIDLLGGVSKPPLRSRRVPGTDLGVRIPRTPAAVDQIFKVRVGTDDLRTDGNRCAARGLSHSAARGYGGVRTIFRTHRS